MTARLEGEERRTALADLPHWSEAGDRDAITRSVRFADFSQAFAAMTRIALAAERLNHHPEWSNTYNRLTIVLSTHDAGGLTRRDLALAREIDRIVGG